MVINAGSLSSVTGYSQSSGSFTVNGSGAVGLGTGTNNVTIGNGTGTLAISSNGGLQVDTSGNITAGTYNTNTFSSTALTFAGSNPIISPSTTDTGLTVQANGTGTLTLGASTNAITLAGSTTIASGKNLTLTAGNATLTSGDLTLTSGKFSQTYSTSTNNTNAHSLSLTNSNTGASSTTVNGVNIALTNSTNTNNTNVLNGINFPAASNNNSNVINGINFASATGFNKFLSSPNINISSAGAITGTTGITFAGGGAWNFDQSASTGTFATGTGTVTLNGNTTVAANQNLTMASGTGVFAQTYTGTSNAFSVTANSVNSTNNAVSISATGIAGGAAVNIAGGTAITNGGSTLNIASSTTALSANNDVAKIANITFTDSDATAGGSNTTQAIGLNISPTFGATGASGTHEIYGGYIQALAKTGTPTGTTNNAYGLRIGAQGVASGALTNAYDLYLDSPGSGATNNYALYVAGGNVNIQGLTASSVVATDANKNLTTSFASAALATSLTDETGSGGGVVFATSPTIASPTLSGTINASGLTASSFVVTDATKNLVTSAGAAASSELASILSDETGSGGGVVFATNPTVSTLVVGSGGVSLSSSGTSTFSQTYTGTSTAHSITANSVDTNSVLSVSGTGLTTGQGLSLTTSSNPAGAGTHNANIIDVTNANSSAADTFNGLLYKFTNNPSVASNTERALTIQNQVTANTTDNAVAALLLLDNADTNAGGSTVVTDALRITNSGAIAAGVTNGINFASTSIDTGINFSSTPTTNYISGTNFSVSAAGVITIGAVGTASNNSFLCRNGSNQIASCNSTSFVSLAPSSADSDGSSNPSININDTGGGNLLQLAVSSSNKFVIDNSGNITATTGTSGVAVTSTATTGSALSVSDTALTTGKGLSLTTSSNPGGAGTHIANLLDITNANSSAADTFSGLALNFTNNPSVAGNTENVFRIQNQATTNTTDNAVASLLLLDNADTNGTGSTVVTDALRITNSGAIAAGITNGITFASTSIDTGINFSSTPTTNYISGTNFNVTAAGLTSIGALGTASNNTFLCRNGSNQIATCNSTSFVSLAPSSADTDSSSNPSIFINDTSSGNLLQLQHSAADKFVVDNSGNVTTAGTYNGDTLSSTALTFSGATPTISASTSNTSLTVQANGTGALNLNTATTGNVSIGNSTGGITNNGSITNVDGVNQTFNSGNLTTPIAGIGRYHNLLTYSEQFDNAAWTKGGTNAATVTANTQTAPDKNTTADTIVFGANGGTESRVSQSYNFGLALTSHAVVGTVWLKAASNVTVTGHLSDSATTDSQGTGPTGCSNTTFNVTTSWQRFSTTACTFGTDTNTSLFFVLSGTSVTAYAWGAQLEDNATAGVYQQTTTATQAAAPNLMTYSEKFDNAAWVKTANTTVTADTTTDPNSATTADTVTFAANAATDDISQTTGLAAASTTYTGSVWLKTTSGTATVRVGLRGTGGTPESTTSSASVTTTWTRFSVTKAFDSSATGNAQLFIDDNANASAVTVIAWGGQVDQASIAGAYTQTLASNGTTDGKGLVVNGTFDGAGLSDCTASNKRLVWDATTRKFNCVANASLVKTFTDTSTVSLVGTNGTNYWQWIGQTPASPSATLVNSADSVLVQGTVNFQSLTATNKNLSIQLWANTAGSTPSCSAGGSNVQVGALLGVLASAAGGDSVITFSIVYAPGTSSVAFTICSDSTNQQTGNIVRTDMQLQEITTSDLAEIYPTLNKNLQPGDVLTSDATLTSGVRQSTKANDSALMGVVSTKPAQIIGGNDIPSGSSAAIVALSGRVPAKVSNINGTLSVGDPITSSNIPGVGMKQTQPGKIVGRVIESVNTWDTNTCTVVNSMEEANASWPQDTTGANADHPCFAIPTQNVPNVPSTYNKPYVYVGKVMVKAENSYNSPDILSNSDGQLHIQLASSSASLNPNTGSHYVLSDTDGNILTNSQSFSDLLAANGTFGKITADSIQTATVSAQTLSLNGTTIQGANDGTLSIKSTTGSEIANLDTSGNLSLSGSILTQGGSGVAEDYSTHDTTLSDGDVVTMDDATDNYVKRSSIAYDNMLLGVYAKTAGLRMSQLTTTDTDTTVPVALSGRVKIKVSNEAGPIHKGDYLTSSTTPGVAMRATHAGQMIGRALQDMTYSGTYLIDAIINVSYADPKNVAANIALDSDGKLQASNISASSIALPTDLKVAGRETNGTLTDAFTAVNEGFTNIQNTTDGLKSSVLGLSSKLGTLDTRIADIETATVSSATALNQELDQTNGEVASHSAAINSLSAKVDNVLAKLTSSGLQSPDTLISSNSAGMVGSDFTSTAALDANIGTANISKDLSVYGTSYLGDTSVTGILIINNGLTLADNSINVIGTQNETSDTSTDGILFLQNLPLAQGVDIFNGAVTIDKSGTITTKGDIKVAGNVQLEGGITMQAVAGENLTMGDALYVSDSGVVKKADALDSARSDVIGIAAQDALLGAKITVVIGGKAKGFSNLEVGKRYFLGANATITPIPSSGNATSIGVAFSPSELILQVGLTQTGATSTESQVTSPTSN